MNKKTLVAILLTIALIPWALATPAAAQQTAGQTLRGRVVDADTHQPLIGANLIIIGTDPLLGTSTDMDGEFSVAGIPLGRHDVQVSYLGYGLLVRPAVLFTAAKEVVLELALEASTVEAEGVTVVPEVEQGQAINDLALVSARSFSVEETRRFAGGLDDPARLVSAYAGVASTGISENAIIVRGNAPKGVQWRLEGVEIPTPSHFAGGNVVGGGMLTLFSTHLLADSDFLSGAFPAQYGNALAGVFDMRLRTGNRHRHEHAVQVGLMGLDAGSEGPLGVGNGASYLFNYRYSTLAVLGKILSTEQVPVYQDLSFKLDVPTRHRGRFTVWGIGGRNALSEPEERDSTAWEYEWDRYYADAGADVGALGLRHDVLLGTKAYLQTHAVLTASRSKWEMRRLGEALTLEDNLFAESTDLRGILGTQIEYRLGRRHVNQTGIDVHVIGYDFAYDLAPGDLPPMQRIADGEGYSSLVQLFTQSKLDLTSALSLNTGVHAQHFALTGQWAVEPRAAVRWQLGTKQALSLGYGLHSQMEELRVYLAQPLDGAAHQPNRNLDFTKAHHLVLGYDRTLGAARRLKMEAYYQHLYDVPVVADSSFSMINFAQDWEFSESLVNGGAGRNYGIELTLERFLRSGYYYLVTASVFNSRYRGGDGVWRDTRWNRGHAAAALLGKEFTVGGNDLLGIGARFEWMGGRRYSPCNIAASEADRTVVYDEGHAFSEREPQTHVFDLTITYRRNHSRLSEVWALQVKNALGSRGFYHEYSYETGTVEEVRDGVVLPVLSYKLEF